MESASLNPGYTAVLTRELGKKMPVTQLAPGGSVIAVLIRRQIVVLFYHSPSDASMCPVLRTSDL